MWVYVCVYAHTHTHCTDGVLGLSPGVGMRHLEGPKNPDGLNLCMYIFTYVYKVHVCMYMLGGHVRSWTVTSWFLLSHIFSSEKEKQKMWTQTTHLVGKVFLCGGSWPQLQLRNDGTPPYFESFFLEKRPWKYFSTNVLIWGEMNPLHKLEHKITSVGYQSSKAELEISFIKTRLEMWVWERGIDPASGVRLSVTVRREMVRGTTCECKCEKVSQDTVWRGCHAGPLQETRVREPLFKVYDEYKPQFLFPNIVVYSFVPSWCRWPAQYHCPCLNSFNYIHCLDLWNILGSGAELNG